MNKYNIDNSYFSNNEIACRCGKCEFKSSDKEFLNRMIKVREECGFPFIITSWCRCKEHNKAVGGAEKSAHVLGCATDIKFSNSNQLYVIVKTLMKQNFKRIGINFQQSFIHIDCATGKDYPQEVIFKY